MDFFPHFFIESRPQIKMFGEGQAFVAKWRKTDTTKRLLDFQWQEIFKQSITEDKPARLSNSKFTCRHAASLGESGSSYLSLSVLTVLNDIVFHGRLPFCPFPDIVSFLQAHTNSLGLYHIWRVSHQVCLWDRRRVSFDM